MALKRIERPSTPGPLIGSGKNRVEWETGPHLLFVHGIREDLCHFVKSFRKHLPGGLSVPYNYNELCLTASDVSINICF